MGMFTHFIRDLEQLLFPNREQNAIPAMDGPFTPNDRLERMSQIGEAIPDADDFAEASDGAIFVSSGNRVLRLFGRGYSERTIFAEFEGLAGGVAVHPDGRLLVCVSGKGLAAVSADGQTQWLDRVGERRLHHFTSVIAADDGTIFASEGSSRNASEDWASDLMEKNSLGCIISCGSQLDDARVVMDRLRFPNGLALTDDGKTLLYSESWAHRVSTAAVEGRNLKNARVLLNNLVGYPSRLKALPDGGFWLAIFGVRTLLIEFVLREDEYRQEMMRTIPREYWISPSLTAERHSLEPAQWGSIKALGIEKPWAPPRSYGLVARFDRNGEAEETLHSRVGGTRHGITSVGATTQGLIVLSKGAGCALLLEEQGGSS